MKEIWKTCVKREVTVFPGFGVTESFGRIKKVLGLPFNYDDVRFVQSEWQYPTDEYENLVTILKKKAHTDPKYFSRLTAKQRSKGEALKEYVKKISRTKYSRSQITSELKKYINATHDFYAFWWVATPGGEILEDIVKNILEKNKINVPFTDTLFYTRELSLDKHRKKLMKIGLQFKAKKFAGLPKQIQRKLEQHAKEYAWISTSYNIGRPLGAEDFFNLILETSPQKIIQAVEQEEKRKKEVVSKLKKSLAKKDMELVVAMWELIFLHNYQKQTVNECHHKSEPFLMQMANYLNIDRDAFLRLSPDEILVSLQGGNLPTQKLKQRLNYFAIILQRKKCFVTESHDYDLKDTYKNKGDEVRGQPASTGFVVAKARVITQKKQLDDFQAGEVLVTIMTTVEFAPYMRKSAAIVTDEGGITCHAAIFGRELGIPCVIGTKGATKIFKTGDTLEVDAKNGVVKIVF